MAGKNLELALLLKLNDQMSKGLKAAMQSVEKDSNSAGKSLARIAQETNKIRPTGVDRLNASLKKVHDTAKSTLSTLAKIGSAGAQAGAAVMAGGYVAKSAAERPISYDRKLALLSNTANNNLDAAGRIAAKEKLNAGIKQAVTEGGGTPEQALDALNTLVGSGAFGNANQAMSQLPTVQKYTTGTGADSNDLAKIMIAAKQNMGIADKDMPAMLSKAIRAGQEGGFELSDMSKWLPQQMALAATNGMKGMKGFESLLAANQISRIGAGTSDEAGNNLVNLLAKINSQDTAKDFEKQGIDLSGSLAAARGKGMNTLEAFVGLVEKIGAKDKDYTKLRKKAETETGADKKATLEAMADILQQKSIGKAVQDRQALMQLLMFIQQRGKYEEVKDATAKETGTEGENSYQVVASTLDAKTEQMGNKKAFAAIDTLASIDAPLGKLLDKLNAEADAHPVLTTAIYSTATALGILAAAAGAGGLVGLLTGGKGGALEKAATAAAGAGALKKAAALAKEVSDADALKKVSSIAKSGLSAKELKDVASLAAKRGISFAGEIPGSMAAARGTAAIADGAAVAGGGLSLASLAGIAAAGTGLFAMVRHAMEPDKVSMRMPDKNVSIRQRVEDYWNVAPEKQTSSRLPDNKPLANQPLLNMRMPDKNVSIRQRVEDYWNVAPERQTSLRLPDNKPLANQPLLNGENGQQAGIDAIANSLNQVLKSFVSQTIKVDVDVRNGNIVAEVNKANSQQARRN
jgi:hypothetical protein